MLSAFRKIPTVQRPSVRFLSATIEAAAQVNTENTQFKTKTVRNIRDRVLIEHLEDNDKIYFVTLDRPDKLNSLDMDMFLAISEAADDMKTRTNARVAILRGNGRTFSTGRLR
ncbi:hypothetical protein SARC_15834 [Sphaeroforma arctica JP610]|uniref:Enoyl-CoA hydratase/isomerase domain-containing protein n=1 Tax=Sphaeroforma arctica JP610 TaxID=667725 RepID=A0A0L0F4M3_9EUKA|nr:hypothetical protein SARC_15834 [Sphaeroforma arctica JP610]KNC71627.1 hypothetical protein SARC_15834 [Sphaeroforma arctica JP610]|eukprot:XP_014145529.1 hypothetical protein SARC_15834 [Sphaeroforma arctica JP610]